MNATKLVGADWRKSSRSDMSGPNCVEVAVVGQAVAVRDSKDPDGPILVFSVHDWTAFIDGAKNDEFIGG
jgi:hypothetical protein